MEEEDYTEDCSRCGRNVTKVHPLGWIVLHLSSPVEAQPAAVLFCAYCLTDFGEFLNPDLKEDAQWISEKDQLLAEIRENGE